MATVRKVKKPDMTVWGGGDKAYFAKLKRDREHRKMPSLKPGTPFFPIPIPETPAVQQGVPPWWWMIAHKQAIFGAGDKPFLNVICDRGSWSALLHRIPEKQRFSDPSKFDLELINTHGWPLYVSTEFADFHIYPPGRG